MSRGKRGANKRRKGSQGRAVSSPPLSPRKSSPSTSDNEATSAGVHSGEKRKGLSSKKASAEDDEKSAEDVEKSAEDVEMSSQLSIVRLNTAITACAQSELSSR